MIRRLENTAYKEKLKELKLSASKRTKENRTRTGLTSLGNLQ